MSDRRSFPEAADGRPSLPMEPELWAAGLSLMDARFVARQLARQGFTLTRSDELEALRAENARLDKACVEWADVSQANYQRAKAAEAESERLRYVLAGVRGAILTGRNEPLSIWKDQIDIALETKKSPRRLNRGPW